MGTIEVNGKRIYIKPTKSTFTKGCGSMQKGIYDNLARIGITKEYIDLPIPRNVLKLDEPAMINWKVNGKEYFYQSSKQERFIDNLGVLAKVIAYESYAIRNEMKSFGQVMSQFQIGYSEDGVKIRSPRQILCLDDNCKDFEYITFRYKQKCKETHPDNGGDVEEFKAVQQAYEELKKELEI